MSNTIKPGMNVRIRPEAFTRAGDIGTVGDVDAVTWCAVVCFTDGKKLGYEWEELEPADTDIMPAIAYTLLKVPV